MSGFTDLKQQTYDVQIIFMILLLNILRNENVIIKNARVHVTNNCSLSPFI